MIRAVRILAASIFCVLLNVPAELYAEPRLSFSGILAQSQEGDGAGIRFRNVGFPGITNDPQTGDVLFPDGKSLYRLDEKGLPQLLVKDWGIPGSLENDGNDLFARTDDTVSHLSRADGNWKLVHQFHLKKAYKSIAVADAKTTAGFAARGKIFALDGRDVYAFDVAGGELGKVFSLPELLDQCPYVALGIMPGSGDLLVSSYYPDLCFYRYRVDGSQVTTDGWPIRGWVSRTAFVNGSIWGVHAEAVEYPDSPVKLMDLTRVGRNDLYISGLASDGKKGYYLSTSLGIKHYPVGSYGECTGRIGGSGSVKSLALHDSRIVVSLGNLLYRLNLDDFPDSPFCSAANEPWRVGAGWSGSADLIVPDGNGFLVHDSVRKELWRFVPSAEKKGRWLKQDGEFCDLRDLAVVEGRRFFLDGGHFAGLSDLTHLAAADVCTLVVAGENTVCLVQDESAVSWSRDMGGIEDIAVIGGYAVVASASGLSLLNLADGGLVFSCGDRLDHLAVQGKWLVGSDRTGACLRRYKLKE